MLYRWLFIVGFAIGMLILCWTLHCLDLADVQEDKMTSYEQILKNPTGAGR